MALVRGEAIKLRSTQAPLAFAALAVVVTLVTVAASVQAVDVDVLDRLSSNALVEKLRAIGLSRQVALVLVVFGIAGAGGEYRHGTARSALLVAPDRSRLLLARALVYAAGGLAAGVLVLVAAFAIGLPLLGGTDGPNPAFGDYLPLIAGTLVSCPLASAMGVGIGALVGDQRIAVGGAVALYFTVELALNANAEVSRYTITGAPHAVGTGGLGVGFSSTFALPLLALVVWTALALGAGLWRERDRDFVPVTEP